MYYDYNEYESLPFKYNDGGRSKYFKANNVRDCAIRAIAIATQQDYKEVYDNLKKLNKGESCRNGTPNKISKKYLKQLGWKWIGINRKNGESCKLNKEDMEKFINNYDRIIIRVSKHLTTIIDGCLNDTFDCSRDGDRGVYGIWVKENN